MSKVVLITGCSSGIGRDLAVELAGDGYTVVATARNPETIKDLQVALQLPLDVTDNDSITAAVNKTIERFGRIDVLVNNAGYGIRSAVEDTNDEKIHNIFNVNVYGIVRMVRTVLPWMRKQGKGRIINIGSIAGKIAQPVNGLYCASKYAVEALSDALRLELAGSDIPVVLIEPGNIKTNFPHTARSNSEDVLNNTDSVYYDLYQNYLRFTSNARNHEPGPEVVSRVVRKTIEVARPKARYTVGVSLLFRLMPFFSDRFKDFLIKTAFKIK